MTLAINGFKNRNAAAAYLAAHGFNIKSVLAKPEANPKVSKNGKLGVLARPLHLAPASLSGFNTCAMASAGCIAACLHTAGNPVYMQGKTKARVAKTRAYMGLATRHAFVALIAFDILQTIGQAKKLKLRPAVRLNATSDIAFESVGIEIDGRHFKSLFHAFPMVQFYDYTAIPKRALAWVNGAMPANYHLTFSRKETTSNHADVARVMDAGGNVAMVASKEVYDSALTFGSLQGMPVIDGDAHDYRPADGRGVVVLLKAKGDAKGDESGFVLRAYRP